MINYYKGSDILKKFVFIFLSLFIIFFNIFTPFTVFSFDRVNLDIYPAGYSPQYYYFNGSGELNLNLGYSPNNAQGTYYYNVSYGDITDSRYMINAYNNIIKDYKASSTIISYAYYQPINIEFSCNTVCNFSIQIFYDDTSIQLSHYQAYNEPYYIENIYCQNSGAGIFSNKYEANSTVKSINFTASFIDNIIYSQELINSEDYNSFKERSIIISPKFKIIVMSDRDDLNLKVTLQTPTLRFFPLYAGTDNNQYYYTYIKFMHPVDIPDWRMIQSLKNIWAAINGSDNTLSLKDSIDQNGYDLREAYNTSKPGGPDSINSNFSDAVNEYSNQELAASQSSTNNLKSFQGFDFKENDDTISAMNLIKNFTNDLLNKVNLFKALVIGAITFFILAIILGVRRYI